MWDIAVTICDLNCVRVHVRVGSQTVVQTNGMTRSFVEIWELVFFSWKSLKFAHNNHNRFKISQSKQFCIIQPSLAGWERVQGIVLFSWATGEAKCVMSKITWQINYMTHLLWHLSNLVNSLDYWNCCRIQQSGRKPRYIREFVKYPKIFLDLFFWKSS